MLAIISLVMLVVTHIMNICGFNEQKGKKSQPTTFTSNSHNSRIYGKNRQITNEWNKIQQRNRKIQISKCCRFFRSVSDRMKRKMRKNKQKTFFRQKISIQKIASCVLHKTTTSYGSPSLSTFETHVRRRRRRINVGVAKFHRRRYCKCTCGIGME